MQANSTTCPHPHCTRMPETMSPFFCKVTVGLEHASAAVAGAGGDALVFKEVNAVSRTLAVADARGTNVSGMRISIGDHNLAERTFNNTVTRRLISLPASVLGMGTVSP